MKRNDIHKCIDIITIAVIISCSWGLLMNNIYCDSSKYFFSALIIEDIKTTLCDVVKEEIVWRGLPLFSISYVLSVIKYDSRKKKSVLCIISFVIILLVQIHFGIIHYNPIYEQECWKMRHIIWKGTMGLFYAISYNITQYYFNKQGMIQSHIIAYITTFFVHMLTDIVLIASLTF